MFKKMYQALFDFEGRHLSHVRPGRIFIERRNWLISRRLMWRCLRNSVTGQPPLIPGMTRRRLIKMALTGLIPKARKKLYLAADAVELKPYGGHMRAFYLPGRFYKNGASVKIVPMNDSAATRREVEFRQKLEDLKTITIPSIYNVEQDSGYFYLIEEMITGESFIESQHIQLFINQGLTELMKTYKALGITYKPLNTFFSQALLQETEKLLSAKHGADQFLMALDASLKSNPLIPVSYIHNDIQPANIGVCRNELYFFDWEMCQEGSILWDPLKLALSIKDNGLLLAEIAKMAVDRSINSEQSQGAVFTACIARYMTANPAKANECCRLWLRYRELFGEEWLSIFDTLRTKYYHEVLMLYKSYS